MSKRHPPGMTLHASNPQLRAALRLIHDGGHREGVRELAQVWMDTYGIPTRDLQLNTLNSPIHIKKAQP